MIKNLYILKKSSNFALGFENKQYKDMTKQEKQTFEPLINEYQQLEVDYKAKETEIEKLIKSQGHTEKTSELSKQIMANRMRSASVVKNIINNVIALYNKK